MTEKRYSYFKSPITGLYVICDGKLRETFSGIDDEYNCSRIVRKLNILTDENDQLKQFPIKLNNRIQKLQEDLEKLREMDKTDLNPQSVEDIATVIGISLNALLEFKKECDLE